MMDDARVATLQTELAELREAIARHGDAHWPDGSDPVRVSNQVKETSGAPTHSAPEGTVCWVSPDNQGYINNNGSTGWTLLETGGAGADIAALYLVLALSGSLTGERRFVPGTGLSAVDGGANADYTLNAHLEAHAPESHTGTDITAAELETLSDDSDADALHYHPMVSYIPFGSQQEASV